MAILAAVLLLGVAAPNSLRVSASPARQAIPEPAKSNQAGAQVTGQLVPIESRQLSFPASGQIAEVLVTEGTWVEAGEILARLDNQAQLEARFAAAELELLAAQQARQDLDKNAALDLAEVEKRLAEARWQAAFAAGKVEHIQDGPSRLEIDQAYANLRLSAHQLEKAKIDLQKAEKKWNNKKSEIWYFVGRHQYKQMLDLLEKAVTVAAKRSDQAVEKYEDLLESPDEIDLALAQADLAMAQARIEQAEHQQTARINGPHPDEVVRAEARIRAAQAALEAAQAAQRDSQLAAPIPGLVAQVGLKPGEWAEAGQTVAVLVDPSTWLVETTDLTEMEAPALYPGQAAEVTIAAVPGAQFHGTVAHIDGLYTEKVGDVLYTARIRLEESDRRLRWGMTATVYLK
jgi:multidrug resistance efflux pump